MFDKVALCVDGRYYIWKEERECLYDEETFGEDGDDDNDGIDADAACGQGHGSTRNASDGGNGGGSDGLGDENGGGDDANAGSGGQYRGAVKSKVKKSQETSASVRKIQSRVRQKKAKKESKRRQDAIVTIQKRAKGRRGTKPVGIGSGLDKDGVRGENTTGVQGQLQFWALRKGLPPKLQELWDQLSDDERTFIAHSIPPSTYSEYLWDLKAKQAAFDALQVGDEVEAERTRRCGLFESCRITEIHRSKRTVDLLFGAGGHYKAATSMDENSSLAPLGTRWEEFAPPVPGSTEVVNAKLASALLQQHTFTTAELGAFGLFGLTTDSFIRVDDNGRERYFRPVVSADEQFASHHRPDVSYLDVRIPSKAASRVNTATAVAPDPSFAIMPVVDSGHEGDAAAYQAMRPAHEPAFAAMTRTPARIGRRGPLHTPNDSPYHLRHNLEEVPDPYIARFTVGIDVEAERTAGGQQYERCTITSIERARGVMVVRFFDGSVRDDVPLMAVRPTDPRSAWLEAPLTSRWMSSPASRPTSLHAGSRRSSGRSTLPLASRLGSLRPGSLRPLNWKTEPTLQTTPLATTVQGSAPIPHDQGRPCEPRTPRPSFEELPEPLFPPSPPVPSAATPVALTRAPSESSHALPVAVTASSAASVASSAPRAAALDDDPHFPRSPSPPPPRRRVVSVSLSPEVELAPMPKFEVATAVAPPSQPIADQQSPTWDELSPQSPRGPHLSSKRRLLSNATSSMSASIGDEEAELSLPSPRSKASTPAGIALSPSRRERYMAAVLASRHHASAWHRGLYAHSSPSHMKHLLQLEDAARAERIMQSRCMGEYTRLRSNPFVVNGLSSSREDHALPPRHAQQLVHGWLAPVRSDRTSPPLSARSTSPSSLRPPACR